MATSFTKMRDGSWGLRSTDPLAAGQTVTVTKKDGSTTAAVVGRVVWSGNGVSLATIAGGPQPTASKGGYGQQRGHRCRNGRKAHDGPCCTGQHGAGYDCGADCCELD